MTEEKKPFTVSDRRHFTAEGETRVQAPEEKPTPAPPPKAEKVEAKAPTIVRPPDEAAPPHEAALPHEAAPPHEGHEAEAGTPMDFIGLLVSLATQASYLMSPEPASGAAPDLAAARSIIGLLEILKQKTEGRRTPEEDRVLDGLLYELRLGFVARNRPEKA